MEPINFPPDLFVAPAVPVLPEWAWCQRAVRCLCPDVNTKRQQVPSRNKNNVKLLEHAWTSHAKFSRTKHEVILNQHETSWNAKKHWCFFFWSDWTHNFCWPLSHGFSINPWLFTGTTTNTKNPVKDRASITSRRFWPQKIGATLCKGWWEVGWKKRHRLPWLAVTLCKDVKHG